MIEVDITTQMFERAKVKAEDLGILKNSIMSGEGNLIGFLGEEIVCNYLNTKPTNTYDYDFIYNDITIDVKTKKCGITPKNEYECSVTSFNATQKCMMYVFVSVLNTFKKGWILGYYNKDDYCGDAIFHHKGDKDTKNNFEFRCDCYNITIGKLKDFKKIHDPLNKSIDVFFK